MEEVTTMDNLPVTSLTQMATLLDEFETTADVSEEELNGSSEEIAEAMLKELDETELSNTAKSSLQQARRYAERFKTFLRERRLCDKIEKLVPQTLSNFLRLYYHSLRGKTEISSPHRHLDASEQGFTAI